MSKRVWVSLAVLAAIAAPAAAVAFFQATQLPIGYWNFDNAGIPAEDSIGTADGTLTGAPPLAAPAAPAPAFSYGNTTAMTFTNAGGDQFVALPTGGALDTLQTASYSISAWFRPASIPAAGTRYGIVMKSNGDNEGLVWRDYAAYPGMGVFEFWHWSDPTTLVNPGSWSNIFLAPSAWYHVAGVWDSSVPEARLYVNNVLIDNRPTAGTGFVNGGPWRFGIGNPAAALAVDKWQADGALDDVRLYTFALNSNQVAVLWNGVPAPTAVTATPGAGAINLGWTAPPQAVTYTYDIGRRVTGTTTYTIINGAPVSGLTYSDASGVQGTSYDYVIYAVSVARSGPSVTPATAVAPPPPPPPGPHVKSSGGNDNLAHRCGCSTAQGPGALGIALALAGLALILRRR